MLVNAVQPGATWCKIVKDSARWAGWCKARWCMMVKASAMPCSTIQYHLIPRNTTQTMPYHAHQALSCNTMQYHVILCSALQYSATPCYTLQYQYHQQLLTAMIWWRLKLIMFVLFGNDGNNHLIINDWRVMIILMLISWYGQWSSSESMWLVKRWW